MDENLKSQAKQELKRLLDNCKEDLIESATDWVYERSHDLKGKRPREETLKLEHDAFPAYKEAMLLNKYDRLFKWIDKIIIFRSEMNFRVSTLEKGFLSPIKALQAKVEQERLSAKVILEIDKHLDNVYETILYQMSDKYQEAVEKDLKETIRQLKIAEDNLEKTVDERTRELKKRVEELENFHKLTVGRELKMIELKKELDELKRSREVRK